MAPTVGEFIGIDALHDRPPRVHGAAALARPALRDQNAATLTLHPAPAVEIAATVVSSSTRHEASVRTGAAVQSLVMPRKSAGHGCAVNGGELLMLALATCYCNDLYREAQRLGIAITGVQVEATAEFPGIGLAATHIRYRATVESSAAAEAVAELLRQTDAVAEVHNTVRSGVPVRS